MKKFAALTTILALAYSPTAQAHPHLFVGVDVTVIYDGDRPTAVELTWRYDDFFSLLLTSDLGIDLDGDLLLDADELVMLTDAVTTWPADFGGDLEVMQSDAAITLGPRSAHRVDYADGLITETHVRPITGSIDPAADLNIRVYDAFYYIAYELNGPVAFQGRDDCTAGIIPPDLNAAYSLVDELLYGRPASDVGADEAFPEVGVQFAQTIVVSCAG